jgi:hypothetical protein
MPVEVVTAVLVEVPPPQPDKTRQMMNPKHAMLILEKEIGSALFCIGLLKVSTC